MRLSTDRRAASWIFASVLLLFILAVFVLGPDSIPVFKQRILIVLVALFVGLMTYFLTGSIALRIRTSHPRLGSLLVTSMGGIAAVVGVVLWWEPSDDGMAPRHLQVDVIASDGRPVPDAELHASIAGAFERSGTGWIFRYSQPAGSVTFHASRPDTFERGNATVALDRTAGRAEVRLRADRSASVEGLVLDADRGSPLRDVQVSLARGDTVATDTHGRFAFAHVAAPGQSVRVRFQRRDYHTEERELIAGADADVRLERVNLQ